MAACQINLVGIPTAEVLIRYTLNGVQNRIIANTGDPVFVDTTATNVTYTILSGAATITSSCISITNLPISCHLFKWVFSKAVLDCSGNARTALSDYAFTHVNISSVKHPITNFPFTTPTGLAVGLEINKIGDDRVQATAFKNTITGTTVSIELLVKVLGNNIPELELTNFIGNQKLFIKGVSSSCSTTGFTLIDIC